MTSNAPLPRRRRSDLILPKADLSDDSLHTAKELRRNLRVLMVLTVVLYCFVMGLAGYAYFQGQRNTKALCTIRNNADDRIEQTQQFLQDHPNGVGGISALDLRRSLSTYQNTVRALEDIDCPSRPRP